MWRLSHVISKLTFIGWICYIALIPIYINSPTRPIRATFNNFYAIFQDFLEFPVFTHIMLKLKMCIKTRWWKCTSRSNPLNKHSKRSKSSNIQETKRCKQFSHQWGNDTDTYQQRQWPCAEFSFSSRVNEIISEHCLNLWSVLVQVWWMWRLKHQNKMSIMWKTFRPLCQNKFSNMELKLTIGYYCSPQLSKTIYWEIGNMLEGRGRRI